jgi:hypothetical protein
MSVSPLAESGEVDPERLFIQEFSDFTGIARIIRSHVEELNQFRYLPGASAGWLEVKTIESSRIVTAMARLQLSQATALRSLVQLTRGGQHVVIEHRRDIPPSRNRN